MVTPWLSGGCDVDVDVLLPLKMEIPFVAMHETQLSTIGDFSEVSWDEQTKHWSSYVWVVLFCNGNL